MKRAGVLPVVGLVLCTALACESDVTLSLLKSHGTPMTIGQAGAGDATAGATGEAGIGGAAGEASAGAAGEAGAPSSGGNSGGGPIMPCEKLGTELCNGGDDDCNGSIDDECNYTIRWAPDADGDALGHETGGFAFEEPCPDGSVLAGLRVGMGQWLNQVASKCRQVELDVDTSKAAPVLNVKLGPWHDEPLAPASSGDMKNMVKDLSCPDGTVLSGADGTTATDTARYVFALRISCAPLIVTESAQGPVLDTDRSQEVTVGPRVCDGCSTTPAYNYGMAITPGHVATRLFGGVGLWVDRVGFGASLASISAL